MEQDQSQAERNQRLVSQYGLFLRNSFGAGNPGLRNLLNMVRTLGESTDSRTGLIDPTATDLKLYSSDAEIKKLFEEDPTFYMLGRNVETQQQVMAWLLKSGLGDTETLSVGSGPAPAEIFLSSAGLIKKKITALDFSAPLLNLGKEIAKKKGVVNIDFVEKAASEVDYQDQFGQVIMIDLLHWVDNWRDTLERVVRATRNGGNIFIVYVSKDSPRIVIPEFELAKTLLDMGTDIVDTKYMQGKDLPRVMIAAKKQQPVKGKLFVPSKAVIV